MLILNRFPNNLEQYPFAIPKKAFFLLCWRQVYSKYSLISSSRSWLLFIVLSCKYPYFWAVRIISSLFSSISVVISLKFLTFIFFRWLLLSNSIRIIPDSQINVNRFAKLDKRIVYNREFFLFYLVISTVSYILRCGEYKRIAEFLEIAGVPPVNYGKGNLPRTDSVPIESFQRPFFWPGA